MFSLKQDSILEQDEAGGQANKIQINKFERQQSINPDLQIQENQEENNQEIDINDISFSSKYVPEPYALDWVNRGQPTIEDKKQEVRIAYLICNGQYYFQRKIQNLDLEVIELAQHLEHHGFEVNIYENTTKERILSILQDIYEKTQKIVWQKNIYNEQLIPVVYFHYIGYGYIENSRIFPCQINYKNQELSRFQQFKQNSFANQDQRQSFFARPSIISRASFISKKINTSDESEYYDMQQQDDIQEYDIDPNAPPQYRFEITDEIRNIQQIKNTIFIGIFDIIENKDGLKSYLQMEKEPFKKGKLAFTNTNFYIYGQRFTNQQLIPGQKQNKKSVTEIFTQGLIDLGKDIITFKEFLLNLEAMFPEDRDFQVSYTGNQNILLQSQYEEEVIEEKTESELDDISKSNMLYYQREQENLKKQRDKIEWEKQQIKLEKHRKTTFNLTPRQLEIHHNQYSSISNLVSKLEMYLDKTTKKSTNSDGVEVEEESNLDMLKTLTSLIVDFSRDKNNKKDGVSDKEIKILVKIINKCKYIDQLKLRLANNLITDKGFLYLVKALDKKKIQLVELEICLDGNPITDKSINVFSDQILENLFKVKMLSIFLANTDLSDYGSEKMLRAIQTYNSNEPNVLQDLILYFIETQISKDGSKFIKKIIKDLDINKIHAVSSQVNDKECFYTL